MTVDELRKQRREEAKQMLADGVNENTIMRRFGVSRSTVYILKRELGITRKVGRPKNE